MTGLVFVDSNVLVYWLDASEPDKQRHAETWLQHLWANRAGRLSFQVLLELYVIVTQRIDVTLSREEARTVVRSLLAWDLRCSPTIGRSPAPGRSRIVTRFHGGIP